MSNRLYLFILFTGILLCSCEEEPTYVDDDLKVYFEKFQEEAKLRNINIDFQKKPVIGRLEVHQDEIALGWCNYDFDAGNMVTINLIFWDILDDLGKEKLVFHELGHCVLNRSHLDRIRRDGFCHSIMHSGQACADDYTAETRETYLNELFLR